MYSNSLNEPEIFDRATLRRGGLLLEQPRMAAGFREICFERLYRYETMINLRFPRILHDFINNLQVNGTAFPYETYHVIGIHSGSFFLSYALFSHMMAQKSFRPHVGDTSNDEEIMSLSDYTIDLTNWWGKGRMSNCKIRQLHAAYLATFATYFIFEHELTHILHGHADYIQVNFNLTMSETHSVK